MAAKKSCLVVAGKLLIHEFRNCVHQLNMELDLAELGVEEKFKYADLINAVDLMNRSLEDLRARLVRMEESRRGGKIYRRLVRADNCTGARIKHARGMRVRVHRLPRIESDLQQTTCHLPVAGKETVHVR